MTQRTSLGADAAAETLNISIFSIWPAIIFCMKTSMNEKWKWHVQKTEQGIPSQQSEISSTSLGYDDGTSIHVTDLKREQSEAVLSKHGQQYNNVSWMRSLTTVTNTFAVVVQLTAHTINDCLLCQKRQPVHMHILLNILQRCQNRIKCTLKSKHTSKKSPNWSPDSCSKTVRVLNINCDISLSKADVLFSNYTVALTTLLFYHKSSRNAILYGSFS